MMSGIVRYLAHRDLIYAHLRARYLSLCRGQIAPRSGNNGVRNAGIMRNNNGKCDNNKTAGRRPNFAFRGIKAHYSRTRRRTRSRARARASGRALATAISREVYALDQLFHGRDSSVVRFMTLLSGRPNGARHRKRERERERETGAAAAPARTTTSEIKQKST